MGLRGQRSQRMTEEGENFCFGGGVVHGRAQV